MDEIQGVTDFPQEIFLKTMSYTNHWCFINASLVSKKWHSFLTPSFKELKDAYELLIPQNHETIIDAAKQSLLAFQSILMSTNLLKKLTLDQVVEIASHSYEHASMVFKSRIFIDKPVGSVLTSTSNHVPKKVADFSETFDFIMKITNKIATNIFHHWLSEYDYQDCVEKLKRPELLEEDFSYQEHCDNTASSGFGRRSLKHYPKPSFNHHRNTPKKLCRNYIARSIAELDTERLFLVAQEVRYVLNKKRLVELARKSPEYASAILDENVSKGKLNNNMLEEIKSMSREHQRIISRYITNLFCFLPLTIIRQQPYSVKSVAMQLIHNLFYKPNNAAWKTFQTKYPEKANRINEILRHFKHEQLLSGMLTGIACLSIDCAKAVFSIPTSKQYFNQSILNMLASKNKDYRMLVASLLSGDEQKDNEAALRL